LGFKKFVANHTSYINESSLFASSDLRFEQEVVSIYDQPAEGKSGPEIVAAMISREVRIKVIAEAPTPNAVAVEMNTSQGPNGAPDRGIW
jgi:hypothetical protein